MNHMNHIKSVCKYILEIHCLIVNQLTTIEIDESDDLVEDTLDYRYPIFIIYGILYKEIVVKTSIDNSVLKYISVGNNDVEIYKLPPK